MYAAHSHEAAARCAETRANTVKRTTTGRLQTHRTSGCVAFELVASHRVASSEHKWEKGCFQVEHNFVLFLQCILSSLYIEK